MSMDKKTFRRIFLGVIGCIFVYWVLHEFRQMVQVFAFIGNVLSPFIIGASLAFVLNVPMRAIERWLKWIRNRSARRGLSILLTVMAVLIVLTGVFWLLIPQLIETGEKLVQTLPNFFNQTVDWINRFLNKHPDILNFVNQYTNFQNVNWSNVLENILSVITGSVSSVAGFVFGAIVDLSSGILNAVLSIFFCFYALARKEILARQGRRLLYSFLPEKFCDETIRILRMSNATFSNFISGQCLEAVILGAMFAVSMAIFKMPFIPLISVVISITALIPIVGAFAGCIIGAFLILMQDPMMALWFVVMFLVLQQIEEQLIYPRVVGTSVGLPGMWILVAVGVGGEVMGVSGILIMIPLMSVLYALAREITNKRVAARGIDPDKLRDHPPEITSKFKEKRKARRQNRLLRRLEKTLRLSKDDTKEDDTQEQSE